MDIAEITTDIAGDSVSVSVATHDAPGPTVVFLHGFGSTKEDYADATQPGRLADHGIVAMDAPGCGHTAHDAERPVDLDLIVDVADAVLRQLGVDIFHLVGHSMGGAAGSLLASRRKDGVLSYTNIEGNLRPVDCFFSRQILDESDGATGFLHRLAERTAADGGYSSVLYAMSLEHKVRAEVVASIFHSLLERTDSGELEAAFLSLPCPRMFMHGDANRDLPYLDALARAGVLVAEIPESGHFPMYSNPPSMWRALAAFIHGVEEEHIR